MTENTEWVTGERAIAEAHASFNRFIKKVKDDAFHAGFQAGTQSGLRAVMPVAAQAMRESADMWPNFPKELVMQFADIMEHEMTERLAEMIPNAADVGKAHEQKQA